MAPQQETAGLMGGEKTVYGALDLGEKSAPARSSSLKIVLGLGLAAVMVAAAAFASTTSESAVTSVVNEGVYEGDDLDGDYGTGDCACRSGQKCQKITGQAYGYCQADLTASTCIGFDYVPAFNGASTEALAIETANSATLTDTDYFIHCNIVQGLYDCYAFPCINQGYCIDGSNSYTCVCTYGYEGKNCELDIDECGATTNPVCHEYATCSNAIVHENGQGYGCECNPGFFGDGYATNQGTVAYGSILTSSTNKFAWHTRDTTKYTVANSDSNGDGIVDRFGCTDINDCSSTPCMNGGRCIDLWDGAYRDATGTRQTIAGDALSQSSAFKCDCTVTLPNERWAGDYCEENVNECEAGLHNCDKDDRAECTDSEGSFSCQCKTYWEGDGYSKNTVAATWGCTTATGCKEAAGYIGCTDIDDCSVRIDLGTSVQFTTPCQNGGTCVNDGLGTGLYKCYCVIGWRGHDCEIDINECDELSDEALGCDINAYCHNTPGSWQCLCNNGWTGDGEVEGGCYDADDCEFSPCQHGGTCTDCGTLCYICDCIVGWRGKSCETDWDECIMGIHTCHDMAMCINIPGSFECECEPGYSGDGYELCNEVNDCNRYADDAAVADATLIDYGKRVYTAAGAIDASKSTGKVVGASWMDDYPIACGGKGWQCFDGNADAKAPVKITAGLVHQCGEFDPARKIFQRHGNCEDIGAAAFLCTCEEGWSDSNCDLDIDECARETDTCHKYATCTNTDGSYTCKCNTGFSGDGIATCHDIDDCSIGSEKCDKGFCTDLGVGDFRCTCNEGYTDRLCNQDIDECAAMTHTCYVNIEQCFTTTQCMDGTAKNPTTGKMEGGQPEWLDACSMNSKGELVSTPCNTIPKMCKIVQWEDDFKTIPKMCKNDYKNGICTNTNGSYRCACRPGFVGDGIGSEGCTDIDECGSAPCENGSCMDDGPLAYMCQCDQGWTDTNCDFDVNECLSGAHNCHPDGKCVNVPGAYYCRCVSGYTGDGYTCTDLDDCDPDPCDPEHGVCVDQGANRYGCICTNGPQYDYESNGPYGGFMPPDCSSNTVECLLGTHECDPNASCYDVYGSYICECNENFYGDGLECAPCTECRQYCPEHAEGGEMATTGELAACGSENWIKTGFKEDTKREPCDRVDRTCINVNECLNSDAILRENCDENAACDDNEGSFTCECEGEWWGTGIEGECYACTECGLGEYLKDDCTSTSDRECRVTIPDGNYAMQTDSGSVSQCLVHWKEPGQIYPERYSWGGRSTTATEGADEFGAAAATKSYGTNWKATPDAGVKPAPDYCENPICGVCDWNDNDPKDNLVKGMETVWTFKRLVDDLYLIFNGADGNGFRCFGFQTPDAPYPTMLTWKETQMEAADGVCATTTTKCQSALDCQPVALTVSATTVDIPAGTIIENTVTTNGVITMLARGRVRAGAAAGNTTITVTVEVGTFGTTGVTAVTVGTTTTALTVSAVANAFTAANSICQKENLIVGEWVTDLKGVEYEKIERCELNRVGLPINCKLDYFCGFTDDTLGSARTKLMSNGGAVWNVKQLGCTKDAERRWLCQRDPIYENKFMIRSLAGQDTDRDNAITPFDYECLYFPQIGGGQYTHPRRAPKAPTQDGVWGGIAADADGNGDNECGILPGEEGMTQEKALVDNMQATWSLIPLPDY